MNKLEISIIIRTYNEEKYLGECLKSVFSQKINKKFEVIIVDSQSSDSTLSIAKKFQVRVLSINKKDFTYGRALNVGCKKARGNFLVFLSAHAIPVNENWLFELIRSFDANTAGVLGKQIPMKDANPLARRFLLDSNRKPNISSISNTNSAIRKDFWKLLNFNENMVFAEDYFWSRQIKKMGYKIKYNPLGVVYHSHNDSLKKFFHRNHAALMENDSSHKLAIYFKDTLHNLIDDIRYVSKRRESTYWIFYAFVLFIVKILVLISVCCRS